VLEPILVSVFINELTEEQHNLQDWVPG